MPRLSRGFVFEGDVEGHSAGQELDVSRMKLETIDGQEITLEPVEAEDGDRWQVVAGPDDLIGHMPRIRSW